MLALTATATREVRRDILGQLGMEAPFEFLGSFYRPNLKLHAVKKGGDGPAVREAILRLVQARAGQSGIVYCLSRKSAEATAEYLGARGCGPGPTTPGWTPRSGRRPRRPSAGTTRT